MSRPCSICISEHRMEVDRLLVRGIPLTEIAKKFNFDIQIVTRHRSHVNHQLITYSKKQGLVASERLFAEIDDVLTTIKRLLVKAEDQDQIGTAIIASNSWRETLKFCCGLGIELKRLELETNPGKQAPVQINVALLDESEVQENIRDEMDDIQEEPASDQIVDLNTSNHMLDTGDHIAVEAVQSTISSESIPIPTPKKTVFKRKSIKPVESLEEDPLGPDNNSIKCVKKPVSKPKKTVRKKQAGSWAEPKEPVNHLKADELKNDPEDKFAALAEKYIKQPKKHNRIDDYTEEQLNTIDMEGRTLRENLERRPLSERCR